jgi:hypothetical protein
MFQNPATVERRIRELIAYLEVENRNQAALSMENDIEFLKALLKPVPDQSKPSSSGVRESVALANDFGVGIDQVRETLVAYDHAPTSLAGGDVEAALVSVRKALVTGGQKPTPEAQGE